MIELIKEIPLNILSVALGSLIALGGVVITNRNHSKRLEIQLSHDREVKTLERKTSMRKEVYLTAVEELVKANGFLGSLTQVDLVSTNIAAGLKGFFIASAKLSLVAEDETNNALNEVLKFYHVLIFKLMKETMPIGYLKTDINIINAHYEESQSEIKRVLAEMVQINESGNNDPVKFSALQETFEFQQKQSREMSNERDGYWNELNNLNAKFAKILANEMKELVRIQVPLSIAIRKELDIKTNHEIYEKNAKENADRIVEQLDDLIAYLNEKA